jgi:hypothetical protein
MKRENKMFRLQIPVISRDKLIQITEASEVSGFQEAKDFVADMIKVGRYADASEDEIERQDNLDLLLDL